MSHEIDHILWATPDFDRGVATMHSLTGVAPAYGGVHPGLGTRNATLALGRNMYLEVIGPDPEQELAGTVAASIASLGRPGVFTVALRTQSMEAVVDKVHSAGLQTAGPTSMSRQKEDGTRLHWQVLMVKDAEFGWLVPFFIDWGDTPHPAGVSPTGCELVSCTANHSNRERLTRIYRALDIPLEVVASGSPGFTVELATPNGRLGLTGV